MTAPDTNTAQNATPPQPGNRWVRVALAVSLAINLAVAGMVAGTMFSGHGPMRDTMAARDLGFGPFTEALSKDDRRKLRRAFLVKAPDMRDARRASLTDIGALLAQLRAVPFDAQALGLVFERQTQRNAERLQLGQGLIYDLIVGMTDAERLEFAGRLEKQLAKGPKQHAPADP